MRWWEQENIFNNKSCSEYDEEQTKNYLELRKNVLNTCENKMTKVTKISNDFETKRDFELKENSKIN